MNLVSNVDDFRQTGVADVGKQAKAVLDQLVNDVSNQVSDVDKTVDNVNNREVHVNNPVDYVNKQVCNAVKLADDADISSHMMQTTGRQEEHVDKRISNVEKQQVDDADRRGR